MLPDATARQLIAVIGGESTGKTSLVHALARELPGVTVPETLRDWVTRHGRAPSAAEQSEVMRTHRQAEAAVLAQPSPPQWVLSDSGPLMTAVYSILYYGDHSLVAEATRLSHDLALVVWCGADIPWVPDGEQRDGPHMRQAAQDVIGEMLGAYGLPYVHVRGSVAERVAQVRYSLGVDDTGLTMGPA